MTPLIPAAAKSTGKQYAPSPSTWKNGTACEKLAKFWGLSKVDSNTPTEAIGEGHVWQLLKKLTGPLRVPAGEGNEPAAEWEGGAVGERVGVCICIRLLDIEKIAMSETLLTAEGHLIGGVEGTSGWGKLQMYVCRGGKEKATENGNDGKLHSERRRGGYVGADSNESVLASSRAVYMASVK